MKKISAINAIKSEHGGGQARPGRVGQVKIKQTEIKSEQRKDAEKVTGSGMTTDDRTAADALSDVSDDQEYEDDFEVSVEKIQTAYENNI